LKNKKKYKSKKWLDPNTTSFIYTEVEFDYNWGATLKMGDCQRIVNFDVYIDDEKSRKKTLKKLNLMRAELDKLVIAIEGVTYG